MSRKLLIIGIIIVIIAVVTAGIIFFTPKRTTVSWSEAIRILNSGQVESVFQTHSLDVTLVLKNGTSIYTKEPSIDDIFDEVKKCGNLCKNITQATE